MTIALPPSFKPSTFMLRQQTNQLTFASSYGGAEQTVDRLQDRWVASLTLPPTTHADRAADREAFLNAMRGMTQTCNLYHFARPVPRGTMRGSPTVYANEPAGSNAVTIQTVSGVTLLAGDMVGIGGLLLQCSELVGTTVEGRMRIPLVNRLRKALTAGTAVIWDRPKAPFRMVSPVGMQFVPGYAESVSLDFLEAVDL